MDKKRLRNYRDKLLARRETIVTSLTEADRSTRDRDAEATQDPNDIAANAYAKELSISMSDNDRRLLGMINEALNRIEGGEYGECVNCGEPVHEKRLEAVPWARLCVKCQDMQERGLLIEDEE